MNRARRNWTAYEDALLRQSVQKELDNQRPLLWRELAKHIPGRSNKDCRKRWWNSLAGSTAKGAWSPEEDRRLIESVEKNGTNWIKVAAAVGTRCADQCSGHWRHVLNPNINYSDWTAEEDEQLLQAVEICGTNWSTIAGFHTPQRTSLALKNQYCKLRQRSEKASERVAATLSHSQTTTVTSATLRTKRAKKRAAPSPVSNPDEGDGEDDEDENEDEDGEMPVSFDVDMTPPNEDGYDPMDQGGWLDDWPEKSGRKQKLIFDKSSAPLPSMWPTPHSKRSSLHQVAEPGGNPKEDWQEDVYLSGNTSDAGEQFINMPLKSPPVSSANPHETQSFSFTNVSDIFHEFRPLTDDTSAAQVRMPATTLATPIEPFHSLTTTPPGVTEGGQVIDPALRAVVTDGLGDAAGLLSHSISISLSCSTDQLSNVMSLLASTGLPVHIKIDPKQTIQ